MVPIESRDSEGVPFDSLESQAWRGVNDQAFEWCLKMVT